MDGEIRVSMKQMEFRKVIREKLWIEIMNHHPARRKGKLMVWPAEG